MNSDRYRKHRERAAAEQRAISRSARDIGAPPSVRRPKRRAKCETDFRKYLETYHKPAFPLPWSPHHLTAIERVERTVLNRECFAFAMERGGGKTTILERGVLWATLYRHHLYSFLIGANDGKAADNLQHLQIELLCNERLAEDFPEVVHALRALDGIANRARGQLIDGEPTFVEWGRKAIVFPTVEGEPGAVIKVGGILSAVRGAQHVTPDGRVIRPSLCLLDDPQTKQSAESPKQTQTREQIVAADVLGMAGPGESLAALMACTVIRNGDLADRLLNRDLHPHWHGQRTRMIERFPKRLELWSQYHDIQVDELQNDGDGSKATAFYRKHRKAMDAGAKVNWKQRFDRENELSAVQHAMNLWLRDQESFYSEYQNEPLDGRDQDETDVITADELAQRSNGHPRGRVPSDANVITAFVDPHDKLLYYVICAWADDFTGYVIDYGTWPDQRRAYFTMRSAKLTMAREWPKLSKEARIRKALETLIDGDDDAPGLMRREWERDGDGAVMQLKLALVDAGYKSDDVVYPFIRESPHRARLLPAHGQGITAKKTPMNDWKKKRGDRVGRNWRVPKATSRRSIRHLLIDTNHWKSFVAARFAVPREERGALTLFKAPAKAHRLFADHCTAETKTRVNANGRELDEWSPIPGHDNHYLDGVVGNAVAASIDGCELRIATTPREHKPNVTKRKPKAATPL